MLALSPRNVASPAQPTDLAPRAWQAALNAAGMAGLLARPTRLALLVPHDPAVATWLAQTGQSRAEWLADPAALRRLLLAHVLPACALSPPGSTQLSEGRHENGAADWLRVEHGAVTRLHSSTGAVAQVLAERDHAGGSVHLIDAVLAPTSLGLAAALNSDGQLQGFAALWRGAGLESLLHGGGPLTLLAPSDAALPAWLQGQAQRAGLSVAALLGQPQPLRAALLAQLLPGRWLAEQLTPMQSAPPGRDRLLRNGVLHRLSALPAHPIRPLCSPPPL